jgi:hypothetical protein
LVFFRCFATAGVTMAFSVPLNFRLHRTAEALFPVPTASSHLLLSFFFHHVVALSSATFQIIVLSIFWHWGLHEACLQHRHSTRSGDCRALLLCVATLHILSNPRVSSAFFSSCFYLVIPHPITHLPSAS